MNMKKTYRLICLILCFTMVCGLAINASAVAHTQAEALAWVRSLVGTPVDVDGYPADQPYQCVDLIAKYYEYLGVPRSYGNGKDYATNTLPSGWQRIPGAVPQPGDILVYGASAKNPYGHVAIYESDYSTYHQNFNYNYCVVRVTNVRYNGLTNPYWGVVRPDFSNVTATTMAWTEVNAAPSNTNARVSVKVIPSVSGNFGEVGITLYDGQGNVVGQKSEAADPSARTYLNIWYDITAELGVVLNAGHKYTYQYYAHFNGTRFESDVYEFWTTGDADHNYSNWSVMKEATCTKTGTDSRVCKICGTLDTKEIPATGHTDVKINGTAATCTQNGLTDGTKCSVCGTVTLRQETIPSVGHVYNNDRDTSCNICGATREIQPIRSLMDMYRMYDPNSGEHFYTGSTVERETLIVEGWNYEGVGFTFPKTTGKPVYRLYEPITGEHLYTMNETEKATLMSQGWNYEGIAFNSASENEVPQYRLHNPNETRGAYHFTASKVEMANLITAGWEYQGIGWYSCGSMNE